MPPLDFKDLTCDILEKSVCAFGQDVLYYPVGSGRELKIRGIFDGPFQVVDPDIENSVSSNQFSLGIKLKDLPVTPKENDKVRIDGKDYLVIDPQEDGQGGSKLMLHLIL